jgi:hypothetical protein
MKPKVCSMICVDCGKKKDFLVGGQLCVDCYDSQRYRSQRARQKEFDQDLTGQDQESYGGDENE